MISLKNVTKEFRLDETTTITPIRGVELEVKEGEFLMIIGRSGSGKTTLLNICAGLIKPTSGQALIDGVDISAMSDDQLSSLRSRKIGFIFQFQSLLPNLTILENVAIPASALKKGQEDPRQRARELLTTVGLGEKLNALPKHLSAGEIKRVAIARALMNHPEILLADEPTADLDEQTEIQIVSLLEEIHRSGVTVLMITHNLDLIPYSTRALKVEDGRLIPVESEQLVKQRAAPVLGFAPRQDRQNEPVAAGVSHDPRRGGINGPRRLFRGSIVSWLAVTALVLAAFALGLVLPGVIKPNGAQTQASSPYSVTQVPETTPYPYNGMEMGMNSGINGADIPGSTPPLPR